MPIDRMEAFRSVASETGDISSDQLSDLIAQRHGVRIDPAFIPVFYATIQEEERLRLRRTLVAATVPDSGPT